MSIYLSFFYIRKPVGSLPIPLIAYRLFVFLPTTSTISSLFRHGFSVLNIKPLMIAAKITFVEVIWLLF